MDLETNRADSFVRRHSLSSSNAITPIDDDRHDIMENSSVMPIPLDALATTSLVSPSTLELTYPISAEGIIPSHDENNVSSRSILFLVVSETLDHRIRNVTELSPADNSLILRFSNFECRTP